MCTETRSPGPVPGLDRMTRARLAAEYAAAQADIKALQEAGGEDLSGLTAPQSAELEALLDYRDEIKSRLDALPSPGAVKARIGAGDALLGPARRPNLGGRSAPGAGESVKAWEYTTDAGETEAEKFFATGPFKSLAHVAHAVKQAGGRPGTTATGVIGEWREGVARHDEAIKAIACKGVDARAQGAVKAITGLGEFSDSEAALLIPPQFSAGIWQRAVSGPRIAPMFEMIPVTGNGLTVLAYNDKSRADGSRWGGIQAYWKAEADQYASSKPTFRTVELKLQKLTVLVYATDELLEDAPAAEVEITRAAGDEIGFKIDDALWRGLGAGMPLGFLNAPCKVTQSAESGQGAGTIVAANVDKMWARRADPSGANYVWLANQEIEPQLAQLRYTAGSTAAQWLYVPPGGIAAEAPARLKGRPLYFVEHAEALGTEGDLVLVDPTQYACIAKSTGLKATVSMHLRFDYDEQVFKFSFRMDARPRWESALTRYKGSSTLSPVVTLSGTRT